MTALLPALTVAAYSRTLLEIVARGRTRRGAFAVGIGTFAGITKRRIHAMRYFRTESHRRRLLTAALLAAVATVGLIPWRVVAQSPASAPAGTILTVSNQPGAQYATIQAAIDAAPDNATIHIAAGTYEETLTIHRPLTLEGAGWNKTIIAPHLPTAADIAQATGKLSQNITNGERAKIYAAALKGLPTAGALIDAPGHVELRALQLTAAPGPRNETPYQPALLQLAHANVAIRNCALLGSPGDILAIANGTTADIRHSLIAAAWSTGIAIGDRDGRQVDVTVADCDIRNNYYAGITISTDEKATIDHCRISGSAWHGIRYDDASPTITHNRIFNNARSGIYASGRTSAAVTDNLFLANEMDGISCWFGNADTITHNTFAQNLREGIGVLGNSQPTLDHNIFYDNPVAIDCSAIYGSGDAADAPRLLVNLFSKNKALLQIKGKPAPAAALGTTLDAEPPFIEPASGNFSFPAATPEEEKQFGAPSPPAALSTFPLQPQEKSIIPTGVSRDYQLWKATP